MKRPDVNRCDVCLAPEGSSMAKRVIRFGLTRNEPSTFRIDGQVRTTRGSGSIALCETCWGRIAKPHTAAARKARRVAERRRQARTVRESDERLRAAGVEVAA